MMKTILSGALVLAAFFSATAGVRADAVSDQKKAYGALGIDVTKAKPSQCKLLSRSEVERFLGKPVKDGTPAGPAVSGCAWHAADGSNDGLLVTRGPRGDWYPDTHSPHYKSVAGIGERAYTDYTPGVGYSATALGPNGVTGVQFSGKGNADAAVAVLRTVIKR